MIHPSYGTSKEMVPSNLLMNSWTGGTYKYQTILHQYLQPSLCKKKKN